MKVGEIVKVWTGAAIGSPYPPQLGDRWGEAKVLEIKGDTYYVSWTGNRPGALWVPSAAIREKTS